MIPEQWYFGDWECLLGARGINMNWRAHEVQTQTCNGGVCSLSSTVEILGSFREGSGPPIGLTRVNSTAAMLLMSPRDGETWYLANKGKRAEGWAQWQGQRSPFNCARKGSGRLKRPIFHP